MSNRPRKPWRLPGADRGHILPTEAVPDGPINTDASNYLLADSITVRPGRSEDWPVNVTGILIDFDQMHEDGTPPERVAEVLFVGTPEHMRAMGHIFHTAADMAADACPEGE